MFDRLLVNLPGNFLLGMQHVKPLKLLGHHDNGPPPMPLPEATAIDQPSTTSDSSSTNITTLITISSTTVVIIVVVTFRNSVKLSDELLFWRGFLKFLGRYGKPHSTALSVPHADLGHCICWLFESEI